MKIKNSIISIINESIKTKWKMLEHFQIKCIYNIVSKIIDTYKNNKKIFIYGNKNSTNNVFYLANGLLSKLNSKTKYILPIQTFILSKSFLTILGVETDQHCTHVLNKQLEFYARKGDILIVISTTGDSSSSLRILKTAKKIEIFSIGFTDFYGGKMKDICDLCYFAPSKNVSRIQECHMLLINIIKELL
ncbi:MAG: SIS domain-containing protein [Endomicrobium sp.]|jgi:D-sedoheptulose 7-phosphate isomerase|nr:SIS domain-containing protein [Endomicrobium sp.]